MWRYRLHIEIKKYDYKKKEIAPEDLFIPHLLTTVSYYHKIKY